jgi:hypothetical protein
VLDAFEDKLSGELTAAQFMAIQMEESCDNPHLRIRARSQPAVMIVSHENSTAPLTSFTLTINEGPYIFGTGDLGTDFFTNYIKSTIYSDAGVMITSSSASADFKTLTVNFNGLTAGKKVLFNLDLDPTNGMFLYPDYRAALFGAPLPGENPTTPGTISGTFTNNTTAPNSNTVSRDLHQLTDDPLWMNENIRPYHSMDMVEIIPEPGCIVLALPVAAAFTLRRARARRAA